MIRAVIDTSILVRAVLKPLGTVGPVLDLLAEKRYRPAKCHAFSGWGQMGVDARMVGMSRGRSNDVLPEERP